MRHLAKPLLKDPDPNRHIMESLTSGFIIPKERKTEGLSFEAHQLAQGILSSLFHLHGKERGYKIESKFL